MVEDSILWRLTCTQYIGRLSIGMQENLGLETYHVPLELALPRQEPQCNADKIECAGALAFRYCMIHTFA